MLIGVLSFAQMETATVSGTVMDHSGAVVADAQVQVTNSDTNVVTATTTNKSGVYVVPSLKPGRYRIAVTKVGFKQVVVTDMTLNVQDVVSRNFNLEVGAVSESITVTADQLNVNTTDATVSTVIDRQFADNLPLNGRSFQTLIQLTPGTVLTPGSVSDPGQFSVNGQRSSANYFTVDGVSANVSAFPLAGFNQTASGSIPTFGATGGTNGLVSEDALQEFRIQTSTFAAEFGRTPGAQVAIITRSGTNALHGTLFEYLRNDVFDANNWFANEEGLPKSEERINDFGGVLGGPILKDKLFLFFSYEGQRLRLPQTQVTGVPSLAARQSASSSIQPFLNAFPVPNGPDLGNDASQFTTGFSDQATLNATSIRIDDVANSHLTLFGRYNLSPSTLVPRGEGGNFSSNTLIPSKINIQTLTLGATLYPTASLSNDFRFNYSRTTASNYSRLDTLGGAVVPSDSLLLPSPFNTSNATFGFGVLGLQGGFWQVGKTASNLQRQFNVVDNISFQRGRHSIKMGVDFRRLSPVFDPLTYNEFVGFLDVPSVIAANAAFALITSNTSNNSILFRNLGLFAQDTWKAATRLTFSYGIRWDVDFAPSTIQGPDLPAVTGVENLANLSLAPAGTPVFSTKYDNFAPRVGIAYLLSQTKGRETVLRGGFGLFYDLATAQVGDALLNGNYPFGASELIYGQPLGGSKLGFPLSSSTLQPPPISVGSLTSASSRLVAFDPALELPRSFQWNATLEQTVGQGQSVSAAYIGAIGRRLVEPELITAPNPNFGNVELIGNFATSDYNALQLHFQRRLSKGLQALASYTFSHSIDTASSSSTGSSSNLFVSAFGPNSNRGSSDFDVRHAFSTAFTYDFPTLHISRIVSAILGGWSTDSIVQARSATPVTVLVGQSFNVLGQPDNIRPDIVPGTSVYLFGAQYPGGKAFNPAAFTTPPSGQQGDLGRNALRGFGAAQWDFSIRRQFDLREGLHLQFKTEFFNLLNHPNFANPNSILANQFFGLSTMTLAQALGGSAPGSAGFNPIFQLGGPRSIQFALKFEF